MGKVAGLYNDKLGVTGPVVGETDYLVAHGKTLHAIADSGDDACQVTALSRGECGGPALVKQTFADGCFAWINTGCLDFDEHLSRTRCRLLDIYDLQHVEFAILIKLDCFGHYVTPYICICT